MYCGNKRLVQTFCPARNTHCFNCSKRDHFSKLRMSNPATSKRNDSTSSVLLGIEPKTRNSQILVYGVEADAFLDTGSITIPADTLLDTGSMLSHLNS